MTEPACRLCGSVNTAQRFRKLSQPLYACHECGTVFRSGSGQEDPAALYDESYYLERWPGSLGRFFYSFTPEKNRKTRFFSCQLQEFEKLLGGPGRILDVGCANGVFVWLARERGWQAEGLETSGFAAEWGRNQFDVFIHQCPIEELEPESVYDVITLWDTLEHLSDPAGTLRECRKRLVPGGLMAILTPDTGSLVNRLVHAFSKIAPERSRSLLQKLYHEDHLCYFNRDSLARALIDNGLLVQWMQGHDESPRDTETSGVLKAGLYVVFGLAAFFHQEHELLVWARKTDSHPEEKRGLLQ